MSVSIKEAIGVLSTGTKLCQREQGEGEEGSVVLLRVENYLNAFGLFAFDVSSKKHDYYNKKRLSASNYNAQKDKLKPLGSSGNSSTFVLDRISLSSLLCRRRTLQTQATETSTEKHLGSGRELFKLKRSKIKESTLLCKTTYAGVEPGNPRGTVKRKNTDVLQNRL